MRRGRETVSSFVLRKEKELARLGGVDVPEGSPSIFGEALVEPRRERVRERDRERENEFVRESLPDVDAERETGGDLDVDDFRDNPLKDLTDEEREIDGALSQDVLIIETLSQSGRVIDSFVGVSKRSWTRSATSISCASSVSSRTSFVAEAFINSAAGGWQRWEFFLDLGFSSPLRANEGLEESNSNERGGTLTA